MTPARLARAKLGRMRLRVNGGVSWLLPFALLLGCDPKAGLESAAGSIDPNQKSYVDAPGSRLASGAFATIGIDYDPDTSVHLLSRRRDDNGASITLFGQDTQTGCTLAPNVATWFPGRPAQAPYRLLPYFDSRDQNGAGTLHFASVDCAVEPYTVENALGPSDPMIDTGFLIRQNGGLVIANPWAGTTTQLVASLNHVYELGGQFLVWGDGQVIAFDETLNELGRFGNHVRAVTNVDFEATFALEDDDGVSQLIIGYDGDAFRTRLLDKDACALGLNNAALGWVTVHSPCTDPHLVALSVDPVGAADPVRVTFQAEADPTRSVVVGELSQKGTDTPTLTACYLLNSDPVTGLGDLFAVKSGAAPVSIGAHAALDRANVLSGTSSWAGTAVVDVQAGLGSLVRWNWDGDRETVLEGVARSSSLPGVLANFDGVAGDLYSIDSGGNASLFQSGSPPFNTTLRNSDFSSALRLEHYDGTVGELTWANSAGAAFTPVAEHVPTNQYQFTSIIPLPGFAYIADYDGSARTGTLYVQNTALGATSTVAQGVSDFVATNYPLPGILYAIPEGKNAGLWFARAK